MMMMPEQQKLKTLLNLSIEWNSSEGLQQVLEDVNEDSMKEIGNYFLTSIGSNKPLLADYFLRSEYDVLREINQDDILQLYQNSWNKQHAV